MGDFTLGNSPDTLSPCHPIARHPISLSPCCPDILSACHLIAQTSYQHVTLYPKTPYCLNTLSHLHLSHSHPISLTPYLISSSPNTLSPCHPIARHPISLSPCCPDIVSACHLIAQTSYQPVTLYPKTPYCLDTLSHFHISHSQPISLSLSHSHPISLTPYLTHTLSHSHPISSLLAQTPYHHVTLLPGTSSACHPVTPDTLLPGHPISLTPYLISSSPNTPSPCLPIARHPISLSPCYPRHPIAWTPYLTHTLSHSYPISHPISLRPYLTLTLFGSHPYLSLTLTLSLSLSPISLSPYLTHTLSRSHPICVLPYRPCAQEVTEGMLELERSRIETATELEQLQDQKDNLQEHLNMLKHTLVMVTLSHACTLRHASLRLRFCLFLQICCTFKRSFPSDEEKCHHNLYLIFD